YAIRVFGCNGSTDVIAEALDWAVDNDMDVVNMSLGAAFGTADSADSVASDNATKAGVVVVSAAGNDGDIRYIRSPPGATTRGPAAAAPPRYAPLPPANRALPAPATDAARTVVALDANGAAFASGENLTTLVLRDAAGAVSLGCDPAEFV